MVSEGPAESPAVDLVVTLLESPGTAPVVRRLVADDAGLRPETTVEDAPAALAAVLEHGESLFFPVRTRLRVCTQQYGGPQRATVTGLFLGREVNAEFSLTDGCRIADWERIAALLGARPGLL